MADQRRQSVWYSNYDGEGTFAEISASKSRQDDEGALRRMGKQQELKRRFGFLSLFGFSCAILITWESALALFQQAFMNGGPSGVIWGFLVAWGCSTSIYMCLAEMASIAPIAGGQYFWVSILAPQRYKRFLSYLTGWLTSLSWAATLGAGLYFSGTMLQGIIILNFPDYEAQRWHGTLICYAIVAAAVFINTLVVGLLPAFEGVVLFLHLLGFFAVLTTLAYLAPKVPASEVFFRVLNEGDWPTQGLSFCVGFIGNVGTFVGADASVHMSEEIENAAVNVPRAMFTTLLLNGSMGFAMVVVLLFSLHDIESAINTKTGYAFIQILADGTGVVGATILTSFVISLTICAVIGFLATASRMLWSFARDKALPFHQTIRKVDKSTAVPIYALIVATIVPCFLLLINIASSVAYADIVSMSVSGLYVSYFIPAACLLWRRTTGQIRPYNNIEFTSHNNHAMEQGSGVSVTEIASPVSSVEDEVLDMPLMWGPWRVPGLLGTVNNAFACVYCVYVLFWDFWPQMYRPEPHHINYAGVITISVIIFCVLYYILRGRREYQGPMVELGRFGLGREILGSELRRSNNAKSPLELKIK